MNQSTGWKQNALPNQYAGFPRKYLTRNVDVNSTNCTMSICTAFTAVYYIRISYCRVIPKNRFSFGHYQLNSKKGRKGQRDKKEQKRTQYKKGLSFKKKDIW